MQNCRQRNSPSVAARNQQRQAVRADIVALTFHWDPGSFWPPALPSFTGIFHLHGGKMTAALSDTTVMFQAGRGKEQR